MGRFWSIRPFWWLLLVSFWLVACVGQPTPPDPDPDPNVTAAPFVITNPAAGSRVSGAVLFSIQVLDAARFQGAELYVGGERVLPQFAGETPLRVYLIPRDHPEGPLELRAVVRSAGVDHVRTLQVQVVHAPPSSATVGASGAVVGDVEVGGAISTVSIPAGTAAGASVAFETMTKEEVLADTGVDYDGLGVTFLGAQEIRSSEPTGDGVAMTSGGFGPMVQTGQTVVSYRIAPDMGRGVGELMVINGASVAPNGDVVSNPPVVPQGDVAVATSALGTFALAVADGGVRPAATLPAGPPGTFIEVPATGLNIYAVDGYYARFRVGSTTVDVPATIGLNGDGRQYLFFVVPQLPVGAASVDLVWKVADTVFASYAMNVTAPQNFTGSASAIVDANYAALLAAIDDADDAFLADGIALPFGPVRSAVVGIRSELAALPEADPRVVSLARSLFNGGLITSTLAIHPVTPQQTSAACILNSRKYTTDKELARRAFRGDQSEAGLKGLTGNLSLSYLDRFADRLEDFPEYGCDPYEKFLCEELGNCGDDEVVEPWDDDVPNDPLPRPWRVPDGYRSAPRDWVTGMGSAVWSGGPVGGALRDDAAGANSLSTSAGGVAVSRVEPGRYVVRVTLNGAPLPFATEVAEDGYFFLPLLPAGQTSQLVIGDLDTGRECLQDVVGRAVGSAAVANVDFAACAGDPVDPGEYTIMWVGGWTENWTDAQNWEPQRVPNADDDVWIPGSAVSLLLPAGFQYQPPAVVTLRSLRTQGTVGIGNTVLQTTGPVHLGTYMVYDASASVQAGGGFTYDSLYARYSTGGGFVLPAGDRTLKNVITEGTLVVPAASTLTVSGQLTFLNGGWLSGPGTTVVPESATAVVAVGNTRSGVVAGGHTLELHGTFTWPEGLGSGNGTGFQLFDGARLRIRPGGVLRMSGVTVVSGNGTGRVENQGRVEVGAAANALTQSVRWENDGVWQVGAGGLFSVQGDVFRNGAAGELTGAGTTEIAAFGNAEFVGGSITGNHRFANRAGQFGGTTWLASPSAPLTLAAGAEIVNEPNPINTTMSTFTVANGQTLSGGGTFRNRANLVKNGGGTSNWTGVCTVVEGAGAYQAVSGSIDFGTCP